MLKKIFKNIKENYLRNANIRKINKKYANVKPRPLSKKTRNAINKSNREFRKAEKEGRVVYDDIHHRIYIKEKEEE